MQVRVAYGKGHLNIEIPEDRTTVIEPSHREGLPDERAALIKAIADPVAAKPLRDWWSPGKTVCIVFTDITRATPNERLIPWLLAELHEYGVPRDSITLLNSTGTHRGNTPEELDRMLTPEVARNYRVINHDCHATEDTVQFGETTTGKPALINRWLADADLRIITGFIEPHFFAGFSGGPKLVAPGLAGLDTVLTLHNAARIGDQRATWGEIDDNPVHSDIRAIAAGTGVTFAFDVILNRDKKIVKGFAGDLFEMHEAARAAAREIAMAPVDGLFDIVITTNSGFPLDQNLYQAVKGMSAAFTVVKPGGTIICAAECRDGFPDHGSYREVLASASSPQALFADISAREQTVPDQWQVQIQAKIQSGANVIMHTSYLSDAQLATAHLTQTDDIAATVRELVNRIGPGARIFVLPEGPLTVPYVAVPAL